MPKIYVTKSTRQRKNKDGSLASQPVCEICKTVIEPGMSQGATENICQKKIYQSTCATGMV